MIILPLNLPPEGPNFHKSSAPISTTPSPPAMGTSTLEAQKNKNKIPIDIRSMCVAYIRPKNMGIPM